MSNLCNLALYGEEDAAAVIRTIEGTIMARAMGEQAMLAAAIMAVKQGRGALAVRLISGTIHKLDTITR